jgi:hypothetical protein
MQLLPQGSGGDESEGAAGSVAVEAVDEWEDENEWAASGSDAGSVEAGMGAAMSQAAAATQNYGAWDGGEGEEEDAESDAVAATQAADPTQLVGELDDEEDQERWLAAGADTQVATPCDAKAAAKAHLPPDCSCLVHLITLDRTPRWPR